MFMAIELEISKRPVTRAGWNRGDLAVCRALHRRYGTTYYFASRCFPKRVRERTHIVYAFVRMPDEWVDNPGLADDPFSLLRAYRRELLSGIEGVRPASAVLRAFCDLIAETGLPVEEALLFLDAMEQDLVITRYTTYQNLRGYMRGSAAAVGVMMCSVLGAPLSPDAIGSAKALGEAMQLTNFLRDIREDAARGRIYLPLEDLASFEVTEDDLICGRRTEAFVQLMKFEIERARALYRLADDGIALLPRRTQPAVKLAAILYSRILDRIEEAGYDVFRTRARTSRVEKLRVAAQVFTGL